MYNAADKTGKTYDECLAAVGKRATLRMTGKIVEVRSSASGDYIMFQPDKRFGFVTNFQIGMDLDPFELESE